MEKSTTKIINRIVVLSMVVGVASIFLALTSNEIHTPFWMLSISYSLLLLLTSRNNMIYFTPGITVLNIIMLFRYGIYPISIYISGTLSSYANNYNYLNQACYLMLYEQLVVFIALYFTGKKERLRSNDYTEQKELVFETGKKGSLFGIITLCILSGILLTNRGLVGGFSLITKGINTSSGEGVSSLATIIWQAGLAWLYIFVCMKLREKYGDNSTIIAVIISALYILLTFIGQSSISRWYTIISFAAVYFILIKLYPQKKKIVFECIVIPVVILMLVLSVYKNTNYLTSGGDISRSISKLFNSNLFETYFAGVVNVNNAIGVKLDNGVGISSLLLDIVNNMPIVNHWFDTSHASVNEYNMYIGRFWNGSGDQIIPLLGQSLIFFGFVFSPLLSCLSVVLIRKFDRRYMISNSLDVYVYAFLSCWSAVMMILNMTIFLAWMYIRIIPLILLTNIIKIVSNGKIVLRRQR